MKKIYFLSLFVFMFFCGCQSTRYAAFQAEKTKISQAMLVVDVFTYDDIIGDTNRLNLEKNKLYCEKIMEKIPKVILSKGYNLTKVFSPNIGLLSKSKPYKLCEKTINEDDLDELPVSIPPFLLDSSLIEQPDLITTIKTSLDSINNSNESIDTLSKNNFDAIFLLTIRGRVVSSGQQTGQALLTGLITGILSGGSYIHSQWEADYTELNLFVINKEKKQIIYRIYRIDKSASNNTINDLIIEIEEKLPLIEQKLL